MNKKRNWPKDYSDEEIINAVEKGALEESGFIGGKEAGLAELLKRTKNFTEKSDKRNFRISITILIISSLGLLVSIVFKIIK